MTDKLVYMDEGMAKVLKGTVVGEDSFFVSVRCDKGCEYRIGKNAVVSIRHDERGDEDGA
jgi:hypothetical protein